MSDFAKQFLSAITPSSSYVPPDEYIPTMEDVFVASKRRQVVAAVRQELEDEDPFDYDEAVRYMVGMASQAPEPTPCDKNDAFVVLLGDTQMGKGDGGGSMGTMGRLGSLIPQVRDRAMSLRLMGKPLKTLVLVGLGDLIEGCGEQYSTQTYKIDLNLRDQVAIMARYIMTFIGELKPYFEQVVIAGVAGNHGQNRKNGKMYTDEADNFDLLIMDMVQMAVTQCQMLDKSYEKVGVIVPGQELIIGLNVGGVNCTFTHGDLFPGASTTPYQKHAAYYSKVVADPENPYRNAEICFAGHYHTPYTAKRGSATLMGIPALDGGSEYFRVRHGEHSPAGLVTLRVSSDVVGGWEDYAILRAPELSQKLLSNKQVGVVFQDLTTAGGLVS